MPAYSFKERFVPLVIEGSKEQTVRARRKHTPRVGQKAYLYYGMRTKSCRKLKEADITDVVGIAITQEHGVILYNGPLTDIEIEEAKLHPLNSFLPFKIILTKTDRDEFAWRDGFRPEGTTLENPQGAYELMIRFWSQSHSLPFAGDVIYWNKSLKFYVYND